MARDFAKAFYNSAAWLSTRDAYYKLQAGICEQCHHPGDEVHHIIFLTPDNIGDPKIALNFDNLKLLCFECHKRVHIEAMRRAKLARNEGRFEYDAEGNIVPPRVFIVWGAPASGKSSYITKRFLPGDMVVDLDLLGQAVSLQGKGLLPYRLLPVALALRDNLYSQIERNAITRGSVWIAATLPGRQEREDLARRFGAELVHIDTPEEECVCRALKDADRADNTDCKKIIQKYFSQLEI